MNLDLLFISLLCKGNLLMHSAHLFVEWYAEEMTEKTLHEVSWAILEMQWHMMTFG